MDLGSGFSRYDFLLVAIAATMALAWVVGVLSSVAMSTALAVGSIPASGEIGYALFVASP